MKLDGSKKSLKEDFINPYIRDTIKFRNIDSVFCGGIDSDSDTGGWTNIDSQLWLICNRKKIFKMLNKAQTCPYYDGCESEPRTDGRKNRFSIL